MVAIVQTTQPNFDASVSVPDVVTTNGARIVKPYAFPASDWSYAAARLSLPSATARAARFCSAPSSRRRRCRF